MIRTGLIALLCACPIASAAEPFEQITSREAFLDTVADKELSRFLVSLEVHPDGRITGRGFGRDIIGSWTWQGDYFCRDLYWGADRLDPNCQKVEINGATIRFTSDQGTGRSADLTLE
jgi:hypothetical protein